MLNRTNDGDVNKTKSADNTVSQFARSQYVTAAFSMFATITAVVVIGLMDTFLDGFGAVEVFTFLAWASATLVMALTTAAIISRGNLMMQVDQRLAQAQELIFAPLEEKMEELDRLIRASKQMVELQKEESKWLVEDNECLAIEGSTDGEILVITLDLHYEDDRDYQEIIATNLMRAKGPRYRYILRGGPPGVKTQVQDVMADLIRVLKEKGRADAVQLVADRFCVRLAPADLFPTSCLYGLAIYVDEGSQRCLQYLPREIGALNIEIPNTEDGDHTDEWGPRLIRSVREQFDDLFERLSDYVVLPKGL